MFFPGDEEDVEMSSPTCLPEPSTATKSRWVTLSGAPSKLDAPPISPPKAQPLIATPPPRASYRRAKVDVGAGEPPPGSPPRSQSPRASPLGDADPAATAIHTLEESVTHPVRIKEELYKIVSQVGEGTFGKVYKAQNTVSRTFVALKRIRMEGERDGFPVTAMREIKLLQSLRHPNVVRLHEMMVSKGERTSECQCIIFSFPIVKAMCTWYSSTWTTT
jgi:CTD kinase subunit alpha